MYNPIQNRVRVTKYNFETLCFKTALDASSGTSAAVSTCTTAIGSRLAIFSGAEPIRNIIFYSTIHIKIRNVENFDRTIRMCGRSARTRELPISVEFIAE